MLSVKIFPDDIHNIRINKDLARQVFDLLKGMDIHLMLYGFRGTGKKTIVQCVMNSLFPDDKISECPIKTFDGDTSSDVIPIKMSSNYVEINCNLIRNQSRNNILDLMKNVCKNYVFGNDGHIQKRYMIIHDIDILNVNIQYSLRRIMELYTETVVFVFTTSAFNKIIDAFKSRCACLRVPMNKSDITDLMKDMGIAKRTTQAKLRRKDTMLETFLDIDNIAPNDTSYKLLSDFIKGKSDVTAADAKQTMHNIMSLNINYDIIMKNVLSLLNIGKMKPEKIHEICTAVSEADIMCIQGSKIVICLEYFMFKLKSIISN